MADAVQKGMRGAVLVGGAHFVLAASSYVVAIVLARVLGPADYGTFGLIYSLLMATELVVQFGAPAAISRLIAERPDQDRQLTATGLAFVLAVYGLVFVASWISAPWLAAVFRIPERAWLFRIAALDLPFYGAYLLLENVLSGRRDFTGKSIALFAYGMTKLVGIGGLAFAGLTLQGAFIVNVVASIVGLSIVLVRMGPVALRPEVESARNLIKLAAPLALIEGGVQLLLYVDLWSLSLFGGASDSSTQGYYVAAKSIARLPMMISLALNGVLIPSLAHAMASGNRGDALRFLHGTTRFLAIALIPGCALIAVKAEPIMSLLFSRQYAAGGALLGLLVFGSGLLFTVFSVLLTILLAIGRQRIAAMLAVGVIVPAFVANALLVPRFGARGAAIATIVAAGIGTIATGTALRVSLGSLMEFKVLPKILFATACVCALASVVQMEGLGLVVGLPALMVAYIALGMMLGVISKSDLDVARYFR